MKLHNKALQFVCMLGSMSSALAGSDSSTGISDITSHSSAIPELETTRATVKSSAGIIFSHTFDGEVSAGEVEAFDITFEVTQAADTIEVEMVSPDQIIIGGDLSASQSLADSAIFTIPVEVQPLEDGEYYLHIIAHAQSGDSVSSRAFAVVVRVGDIQPAPPPENDLIVMPAEETIL